MNIRGKIISASISFVLGTIISAILAFTADYFLINHTLDFDIYSIGNIINTLMNERKVLYFFLTFEGLVITFILYVLLIDNKPYQSRMMKITNKISTPVPVGQNQYGSARWLESNKFKESFDHFELMPGEVKTLIDEGVKDKKEISALKQEPVVVKKSEEPVEEKDEDITGLNKLFKDLEALVEKNMNNEITSIEYQEQLNELQLQIEKREELIVKIDKLKEIEFKLDKATVKIKQFDDLGENATELIQVEIDGVKNKIEEIEKLKLSKSISEKYANEKLLELNQNILEQESLLKEYEKLEELKKEKKLLSLFLNGILEELESYDQELVSKLKGGIEKEEIITEEIKGTSESDAIQKTIIKKGGLVIGREKKPFIKTETIYFIGNDTHSLILGATRSGKSRCVVLQTIGTLGLAGESIFVTDPKGELYQYTNEFLSRLGYEVICIDFKNPLKSHRYNYLQPIIDAIDENNIPKAIDATWDITAQLVGEASPNGEKIWTNGEASIIAASIMAVVYDNQSEENRKYQNMTNAYFFIAEMCKTIGKTMPINEYMKSKPENHPAKGLLAISEIAPDKTRGSFFTAALTTLRLFTNPLINSMSSVSDYDPKDTGKKKRAIFVILPDEKSTYYSLAALLVSQHYIELVKDADEKGGRLDNRVNFILDEFGNFTKIPDFDTKLTVGGGRGIRFNLFLQSLSQLDHKYGKEIADIIKGNCENWIYLNANDLNTLEELSKKLDNYTTSSYSISGQFEKYKTPSSSHSMNLMARPLLTVSELKEINRPYLLLTSRNNPAIMISPDLSEWHFNKMYGLGNEKHNTKVRAYRENKRSARISNHNMDLWGVWKLYQRKIEHASSGGRGRFNESSIDSETLKNIKRERNN